MPRVSRGTIPFFPSSRPRAACAVGCRYVALSSARFRPVPLAAPARRAPFWQVGVFALSTGWGTVLYDPERARFSDMVGKLALLLRIECTRWPRKGQYKVAKLIAPYGAAAI